MAGARSEAVRPSLVRRTISGVRAVAGGDGIQVDPEVLVISGKKMQEAASGVGKASPHDEFGPLAGSFPGSQTASAAKALGEVWLDGFADLKRDAEDFGEQMIEVGRRYRKVDEHSGQEALRLDGMVAGGSRPEVQAQLHHRLGGTAQ